MTEQQFTPGQRWISNTEPELGLGIISDNENRRVTISFPAAAERRTYALDNAPISRVQYQVGDEVKHVDGKHFTVTAVDESGNCLMYTGVDSEGAEVTFAELELDSFVQFSRPQDRLFSGQVDKLSHYRLRYQTLRHREAQNHSAVRGLLGARVQLLPHQLHIANEVARRHAPRVLLADEVGLGKTIEAGLIIHQQLFTGKAQRVLIAPPESLVHQWLVEMLRRFNLQFTVLDEERCQALEASADNPFESTQLVLCSIDFLTGSEQRLEQARSAGWDLLVVDEAHHLEWTFDAESLAGQRYRSVEALARHTRGLLLLTATPEQLGVESHFARLRLLDPDRYFDLDKYREEEQGYQPANDLVQALLADDAAQRLSQDPAIGKRLSTYLPADKTDHLLRAAKAGDQAALEAAIAEATQHLLDHHGTGRVLFRNTRAAVRGFPARHLQAHPLPAPENFGELIRDRSLDEQLKVENCLGSNWLNEDPRVAWLVDWLKQNRREKVLLICNQQDTTIALEEFLRLRKGVPSTAFHEEMTLLERDRAAAYFADDIDGAQLMVCSEIGSEGRNFQFARNLVLFDLPLNPDLLEQRIGRLARIGQQSDVQIHVPHYTTGNGKTVQEKLLEWYHQGLNAIEMSCSAAPQVFREFRERLHDELMRQDETAWSKLLSETRQRTGELIEALAQGRDRLLELNSCNPAKAEALISAITEQDQSPVIANYMREVFEVYGVDEDHHSTGAIVLHPTDHMPQHHFPGLPDSGLTATYNRDIALSREDMEFFTWEHPLVRGAMDMILSNENGNTALGTIKLPPLKPGTLLLEAIFAVHCPAPRELQLESYFPDNISRILIDSKGTDLSGAVGFEQLNKLHTPVPNRKTASGLIRHAKADITRLIGVCQDKAEVRRDQLIESALTTMSGQLGAELERLRTLAKVNPNIRQEEIEHLEQTIDEREHHIRLAQIGLDAVRVIVCT
ncbi:RNA polymerase-associated protein RapA [Gilvimarinus sp. F26214L]|uniref:RNA polymerase-associated protein RapA n=1 Tax=Gilvimarinus sp. DZF01 TaxID=3461371 RepID=UPI004045208F